MLPCNGMTAPPAGAAEVNVTVPVTVFPASMEDWLRVSEARLGGGAGTPGGVTTTDIWNACTPLSLSVPGSIRTRVGTETVLVAIEKSASVAPAGINTVDGGLTKLVSLLTIQTVTPPGGAADSKV